MRDQYERWIVGADLHYREKRFCSFCPKEARQVKRMVLSGAGQICDECIKELHQQLQHFAAEQSKETK